jgi:zinc transporter ZupT
MLSGSLFAIFSPRQPSKNLAHAIQNLAAGILLSAIAFELIPTIAAAKGFGNLVGFVVGFSLGAMVMIALPFLLKEDEKDEIAHQMLQHECEEGGSAEKQVPNDIPLTSRSRCHWDIVLNESTSNLSRLAKVKALCRRMKSRILRIFKKETEQNTANIASEDITPFPAVFAAAVYIDAAMDGLLVGISLLSGARCTSVTHALHHQSCLCIIMGRGGNGAR